MSTFTKWILKYAGWVSLVGGVLGVVAAYFTFLLFQNLRPNIEELLPTTARSVKDLHAIVERLEATDSLAVLTFSDDVHFSRKFVDELATRLKANAGDLIASVDYKIADEIKYFHERRSLYMDLDDLKKIRKYIGDRIDYEKKLYNPLNIFSEEEIPEPLMDFAALEKKYASRVSDFDRFPGGYYATRDEKIRAVMVYLKGKSSDLDRTNGMKRLVDQTIEGIRHDLAPFPADFTIKFAGGLQNIIEETASLVEDLVLATVVVVILTIVIMLVYFRSIRGTIALTGALTIGTLWTFGVAYFVVGYLNANSAFLASIVIGNGINYGIIFLARYVEERRARKGHERSIHAAINETMTATWTAALAAAMAYGSLMLMSFRGFSQFGVIGLMGMVFCWVASFTLLPAYLTLFERWKSLYPKGRKQPKAWFTLGIKWLVAHHSPAILLVSMLGTALSLLAIGSFSGEFLESDLSKLRDKRSMETGSGFNIKYVEQVFGRETTPVVVLAQSRSDTQKVTQALRSELEAQKQWERPLITGVRSMDDFIPTQQSEKQSELKAIHDLIFPQIYYRMDPKDKAKVDSLLTPEIFKPISDETLPTLVREKFREKNGELGKLILVEPHVDNTHWGHVELNRFVDRIREIVDELSPGSLVAGQLAISSDMFKAVVNDGPRATWIAFLAVVILVVVLFRKPRVVFLTCLTLLLGVLWMVGFMIADDLKINFLNFIALPITFGIGVDYGVNIFQRYRIEGRGKVLQVIENTGGAVILASLTTIIGYGSLLIAGNQAFVSFGMLAIIGEFTCIVAAILTLPAILHLWDQKSERKRSRSTG